MQTRVRFLTLIFREVRFTFASDWTGQRSSTSVLVDGVYY